MELFLVAIISSGSLLSGLWALLKAMVLAREHRALQIEVERQKASTARDLALFNAIQSSQFEVLRYELHNQELVHSKQFTKEFETYEKIWIHVEDVYSHARALAQARDPDLREIMEIQRRKSAKGMAEPWQNFETVLGGSAPFIHETVYTSLCDFSRVFKAIWSAEIMGDSLFEETPGVNSLEVARLEAMTAIRKRVGLSVVA